MTPPPENHFKLHAWADLVALLAYLPRKQRAQVISRAAARLRPHLAVPGQPALAAWQIRRVNQLLGFEFLPVPIRRWRFGPDHGSMRVIGSP